MLKTLQMKALFGLLLFAILFSTQNAQAGVFTDIKLWASERSNIKQHSKAITAEVKTLYRERKSVQRFAEGASNLVKVYQSIRNKNLKSNFPQLLEIARSISQVVSEFKNLAPKAEAMYKNAKPSMKYFSELADQTQTIQTAKKKIVVKTFSDNRLMSLAGANGWNRVFDTVKENPVNIFKWGRLSDEYKLGKIEGQYPLKCAQIAFEASGYYFAAKESMQDLLGIQSEIKGIIGGDLSAILNMGNTVSKIQNSGNSIESIGELAEQGSNKLSMRMTELVKLQEDYVQANKIYNQKYNKDENSRASSPTAVTASPDRRSPASSPSTPSSSVYSPNSRSTRPTTTTRNVPAVSLQQAMTNYQKAYEAYLKISQAGKASQTELNTAIENLSAARQQVEQAKAGVK